MIRMRALGLVLFPALAWADPLGVVDRGIFNDLDAKVEIALATGKREYDKRVAIAARESKREAERALAARSRRQ